MDGCSRSVGITSWALRTPPRWACVQRGGKNRSQTNRVIAQLLGESERVPAVPSPDTGFINVANPLRHHRIYGYDWLDSRWESSGRGVLSDVPGSPSAAAWCGCE